MNTGSAGQNTGQETGPARPPLGVTLREMTPADVPAVHELERLLFPVDAWPLQMFVAELAQAGTRRYVVAELGGQIVGYAGLMCIRPIADVQTIAVVPEQEGKGIGSALLTELIRESLRETDTVFSLSPHEFLVMLPFTGREGAATFLQNLGQAFEKTRQRTDCSGLELLAASVTFPDDGAGSREIITALETKYKELLAAPQPAAVS